MPRPTFRHARRPLAGLVLAGLYLVGTGCTRQAWRERADRDVANVITQKNVFPDWQVRNWHAYPDPRARFADPSRPDRPPYPPDDFAARILAPNPQHPTKHSGAGRFEGTGYLDLLAQWDAENRATDPAAETTPDPQKGEQFPKDFKGDSPPVEKLPAPKPIEPKAVPPIGMGDRGGEFHLAGGAFDGRAGGVSPPFPADNRGLTPPARQDQVVPAAAQVPATLPDLPPSPKGPPTADKTDTTPIDPNAPPKGKDTAGPFPAGPGAPPGGPDVPGDTAAAALDIFKALITNEKGFRLKLRQAVELGLFNSREFQDRREDLYLAALPVTLERFNFAALGFFTEQVALDYAGRAFGRTPRNSATYNTNTGFSKLFPTGAMLAVRMANQVVIDLADGRPTVAVSNLALNLSQPFLRGGGYAVTLEPLTAAERNMVYAIRSYARFRKLFYVAVVAGGGITNNPYGLQGLSVNLGRGVGGNLTAPSVGFLQLNLQAAVIANQRRNVTALEQLLALYQAFREGGQQSDLQVSQVEQQLLNSRTSLLGQSNAAIGAAGGGGGAGGGIRGYLDTLDNFKLQLGLPLTTGLDLDQAPLKPIRDQLARFESVYAQIRDVEGEARRLDPAAPAGELRPRFERLLTGSPLVRGTTFSAEIMARLGEFRRLTDEQLGRRLFELAEERRQLLDRRADRLVKGQPEPEADTRRLNQLSSDIDLAAFERAVRGYEARPWERERGVLRETIQAAAFREVFNSFYQLILEGRNERLAKIRQQWPKLPAIRVEGADLLAVPLDDAYTAGIQAALTHRLDLMNSRGQVVDAWRQIKVQANSLQGVLDLEYNLSSRTPAGGSNPAAFSGGRTNHNITINGELPLVRRAERNNYRAALIGYQRQRRTLQAFEDNIANDVRADIREVRTIGQLYLVQQRLIELGYSQVDNAQAVLLEPPAPNAQTNAGNAAALTNQVLQAQQSLVQAQNLLYSIWVNYLVSRMQLYLDLEEMQIDDRGGWCNELGATGPDDPGRPGPDRPDGGDRLPPPRPAGPDRGDGRPAGAAR